MTFEETFGFSRADVRLGNWRTAPFSRFSFQNTREIVPTAKIDCGTERQETGSPGLGELADGTVTIEGSEFGIAAFLERSNTDHFLALRAGRIAAEWKAPYVDARRPHILFSVTKSITGLLAGILEDRGTVDMGAPVCEYLPELRSSGFGTATLRQLADMRTNLVFDESYLDVDGDYARYRRAMGWNPDEWGKTRETLFEMLMTIAQGDGPHGGAFQYASPNTDVLGFALERAARTDFATLVSDFIWRPLGAFRHAYVTVDGAGAPRAAGGMCASARDLARLAEAIRKNGQGEHGRIASQRWVDDMLHGGDAAAWRGGNFAEFLANGRYRNCWYQTGGKTGAYCCVGIHGQWVYVDPQCEIVLVKLSSQPVPMDDRLDRLCLGFFDRICAMLKSGT